MNKHNIELNYSDINTIQRAFIVYKNSKYVNKETKKEIKKVDVKLNEVIKEQREEKKNNKVKNYDVMFRGKKLLQVKSSNQRSAKNKAVDRLGAKYDDTYSARDLIHLGSSIILKEQKGAK
jgi:uncharacterized membrane protein YcjF (UPF0283 family)